MNWTGGRLQRSRHTGSSLYALQKTHFAKVRTRLQNGPPTRSALVSPVFIIAEDEGQALPMYDSLLASEVSKYRTQRTLDEYHNTAPLAKRLMSIKRRSSPDTAKAIEFHGQRRRSPLSSHIDHHIRHPQVVTTTSGRGSTSLYSKRQAHRPGQSLEARRRELLQRQDWVGAAISKPLKMEFVEDKNYERIGKRRRLREDEHEGRRVMEFRTPLPTIDKRAKIDGNRLPPHHLRHDTISVRMGTSIHSSQPTREDKDVTSQQSRHSCLSDPMLLDAEDVIQQHYGSSWVRTPLDLENDFLPDAPSSLAINTRMPNSVQHLSSAGRDHEKQTIRLFPIPLSCSSPKYTAAILGNVEESKSIGTVNAEATSQSNATTCSERKSGSLEPFGRLVFKSSPRLKGSSTPSATPEFTTQVKTRAHGSGSVPQTNNGVERETYDACWKKLLDISGSSVIKHNTDTSPLSKVTSQDPAETGQALAALDDDSLINNNSLPQLTTAHREPKCARDLELTMKQNKILLKSDVGDGKSICNSRDEDSIWRDFVFGDEMDRDSSNTYERHGNQKVISRSRNQPSASSLALQASSEYAEAATSTSIMSGDSPSSNSYLVPALPQIMETSSPDPLNHLTNSTRHIVPKQTRRSTSHKLLFTKPAPFVGRQASGEGNTFHVGQRLYSTGRLDNNRTAVAHGSRQRNSKNQGLEQLGGRQTLLTMRT